MNVSLDVPGDWIERNRTNVARQIHISLAPSRLSSDNEIELSDEELDELYLPGVPLDTFEQLSELPMAPGDDVDEKTIPREFDARKAWPHCRFIGEVIAQGKCGSWYKTELIFVL